MTGPVYGLTALQADCARVIAELTASAGRSPSLAEIAVELDTTTPNVHRLVACLNARGWIEPYAPQAKRALKLTRQPPPLAPYDIALTPTGRRYVETHAA